MSAGEPVRTILVATDFSDCAGDAIAWAAHLAKAHGARLVIHHALAPPQAAPAFPEFVPYPPELHEQYRQAAIDRLEECAAEPRAAGVTVETDLEVGPAATTILMAAEKHEAQVVVTGTRGLTGWKHLLLGSTAERLVQHGPVPVLSIHPGMRPGDRGVRRILVPTDFSDDANQALESVLRVIPEADDAEIVLFHAFHVPVEYSHLAGGFVMPDLARDALVEARKALEKVAEPLRQRGFRVEIACREGYAPQAIELEAKDREVDWIAMGTHGRSLLPHVVLGSTAERVVQHAPCPVLTIRRQED